MFGGWCSGGGLCVCVWGTEDYNRDSFFVTIEIFVWLAEWLRRLTRNQLGSPA